MRAEGERMYPQTDPEIVKLQEERRRARQEQKGMPVPPHISVKQFQAVRAVRGFPRIELLLPVYMHDGKLQLLYHFKPQDFLPVQGKKGLSATGKEEDVAA